MSAYTSVFMLVYCMEVKKPRMKACTTISQMAVWAPTVEKDMIISADDDRVADQHVAVAQPRQDRRHEGLQPDRGDGLRQDQQARLDRREAEADLIEQREQERDAAQPETREEAAVHGRAEGADPEQPEIEQRKRHPGGVDAVTGEQRGGERQQAQHLGPAQFVVAEYLQHVGQERDAAAEQHQARRSRADGSAVRDSPAGGGTRSRCRAGRPER